MIWRIFGWMSFIYLTVALLVMAYPTGSGFTQFYDLSSLPAGIQVSFWIHDDPWFFVITMALASLCLAIGFFRRSNSKKQQPFLLIGLLITICCLAMVVISHYYLAAQGWMQVGPHTTTRFYANDLRPILAPLIICLPLLVASATALLKKKPAPSITPTPTLSNTPP